MTILAFFKSTQSQHNWIRLVAAFVVSTCASLHVASANAKQQIWFVPQSAPSNSPLASAEDFSEALTSTERVKALTPDFDVFEFYSSYLISVPQEELNAIVANIKNNGKRIAVEFGVLNSPTEPQKPACGGFGLIEGYGSTAAARLMAEKIKKAGGIIDYLSMDEPLWFGHYYTKKTPGQPACNSSVDELATQAAPIVERFTTVFPNIKIVDVEPTAIALRPEYEQLISEWLSRFHSATGAQISGFHLDVLTMVPSYQNDLKNFLDFIKRENLPEIGVICNGKGSDTSDSAWVNSAHELLHIIQTVPTTQPTTIIVQSWDKFPKRIGDPDTEATLSHLLRFVRENTDR